MEHRVSGERLRAQGTRELLDWRDEWKKKRVGKIKKSNQRILST